MAETIKKYVFVFSAAWNARKNDVQTNKKKLLDFLPANCNLVLKKFCTEFRANSSQIEVKSSKMQKYDKNWKTVGLLRK